MTDFELLELAAKSASIEHKGYLNWGYVLLNGHIWNPLTDDGDALRLAVKCRVHLRYTLIGVKVSVVAESIVGEFFEQLGEDESAATRRAIVRAAAIGKSMP